MFKIDINVSVLLKEHPFLERFDEAAKLGFDACEFYWPRGEDPAAVARRISDAGLKVAAFNFDAGDMPGGDRGLLNDPSRQAEMRANVPVAIELANKVGCRKLTALAGNSRPDENRERQLDFIRENLNWVCEQAANAGITVMVEAINAWDNKLYPFTNTFDTLSFLDSVGASNLMYLFDMYHMQRMEGNLVSTLERYVGRIGHIQIADSPRRNQPGTGEINYEYVFAAMEARGYNGFVGLEYNPVGTTEESLEWLPKALRGGFDAADFSSKTESATTG
jgi:hydroxypyruvate isomerase